MVPSLSRDARVRAAWEADRGYLFAIAAGMLGRPAEAEDVVQEAFARLAGAFVDDIGDARGWLVVVTRRLCLDRLGSAEARRTTATPELPEAAQESVDPADRPTLDDEVRRALAVVADRLSPAERTSFILHDIFGFPSTRWPSWSGGPRLRAVSWPGGHACRSAPARPAPAYRRRSPAGGQQPTWRSGSSQCAREVT
jgi:RNA polymerase sigma factor (sigma-70 family)